MGGSRVVAAARMREAVLVEFVAQIDDAVQPTYEAISRLPGYGALAEPDARQVLRSVRWVFVTLADCLRKDRGLTVREIDKLHAIGVSRARWGVPLEAFQEAFSLGFDHAMTRLRGIARGLGDDGPIADAIVRDLVARVAEVVSVREDGYASTLHGPLHGKASQRSALVRTLLEEAGPRPRLEGVAAALGLNGDGDKALFVAVPHAASEPDLHWVAHEIVSGLGPSAAGVVRSRPVPHAAVLWGRAMDADSLALLKRNVSVHEVSWTAASDPCWTQLGVRYRRLRPLVHVVGVVGSGPGLVDIDDLTPYEPLAYMPLAAARAVVSERLGPVMAQPSPDATRWVRTFEELHRCDWVVTDAARRLHVHPNTLHRWLAEFADLTGLDCRTSHGRVLTIQAVHLWHLFGAGMPELGDSSWS